MPPRGRAAGGQGCDRGADRDAAHEGPSAGAWYQDRHGVRVGLRRSLPFGRWIGGEHADHGRAREHAYRARNLGGRPASCVGVRLYALGYLRRRSERDRSGLAYHRRDGPGHLGGRDADGRVEQSVGDGESLWWGNQKNKLARHSTSLAPESGCRRSIDHGVQTLTFHFPHTRT